MIRDWSDLLSLIYFSNETVFIVAARMLLFIIRFDGTVVRVGRDTLKMMNYLLQNVVSNLIPKYNKIKVM